MKYADRWSFGRPCVGLRNLLRCMDVQETHLDLWPAVVSHSILTLLLHHKGSELLLFSGYCSSYVSHSIRSVQSFICYSPGGLLRLTVLILKTASLLNTFEPGHEKMCLMPYANNKGADQTAHPRSLISAFVVRCLDSISLDSIAEISRL